MPEKTIKSLIFKALTFPNQGPPKAESDDGILGQPALSKFNAKWIGAEH
jgi:hypothetical protein